MKRKMRYQISDKILVDVMRIGDKECKLLGIKQGLAFMKIVAGDPDYTDIDIVEYEDTSDLDAAESALKLLEYVNLKKDE